ncbi:protein trapped in endoderm-1 [Hyalella azteca]|uniref:Protein trapped in endoderm-1 n=1 Tax=Hyalella azteca TaxID=294128 RepID=A0A8B7P5R8_HYAAZ|nr:protein trapped in endoderm-1 [Hyalella azteca]
MTEPRHDLLSPIANHASSYSGDGSDVFPDTSSQYRAKMEDNIPPDWALSFTVIAAIIIAIVGFLGNLLTMVALPFSHKIRNASTWFVVNLAATECLFCITILPMVAAHLLRLRDEGEPLFSDDGCRAFVFLRYVNVQAELLSIAGVALNRCILIVVPYRYKKIFSPRNTIICIVAIWVVSIVIMLLPLFELYGRFAYNVDTHECDFGDDTHVGKGPRRVYLAIGFLTPALIIVLSYIFIFYKARSSLTKFRRHAAVAADADSATTSLPKDRPAAGLRARDIRIALTILVIFIVFLVCCMPVSVMHYYDDTGMYATTLLLLHPLYWLQYCLNIFIYVFMNKQYRDAYIQYISSWWPRFQEMSRERFLWVEDDPSSDSKRGSKPSTPNAPFRKPSTPSVPFRKASTPSSPFRKASTPSSPFRKASTPNTPARKPLRDEAK